MLRAKLCRGYMMDMKPELSHEQIGTTDWGDPHILATVLEPHPKAGLQFLLTSTASMGHTKERVLKKGEVPYLVNLWTKDMTEPQDAYRTSRGWRGALYAASAESLMEQLAGYIQWMICREQIRNIIDEWDDGHFGGLRNGLERFWRGLWEDNAIDYREEWAMILAEVARIDIVMHTYLEEGE